MVLAVPVNEANGSKFLKMKCHVAERQKGPHMRKHGLRTVLLT